MICLCWNIRGLGKGEKIIAIRKLVEKNKITFLGLVETKHKKTIKSRIKRMWGNDEYGFCEVFANDRNGGGLIAIWDKKTLNVDHHHSGNRWILLEGSITRHSLECCVGVIYGHNEREERLAVLEEIKQKVLAINKPILMMGDFNVILHPGERIGSFRSDRSMREFSEWITELGLIDIPLHGIKFTWRRNESRSRIDRGLCCNTLLRKFPNMNMIGLKRSSSDHNPLLLTLEATNNWGPKPFRCFDAWFLNPNFKLFLINEWQSLPNESLQNKLKILKAPLKAWKKENFDHIDDKISELESVIHVLEQTSDERDLNAMEKARLNVANSLLHQWSIRRERIWRQRARSYGFKLKYHNTKFFYASTVLKRKNNEIIQTNIKGRNIQGVANLKTEIRNFFEQSYIQEQVPVLDFSMDDHPKITEEQSLLLERTPTREEIKHAVWACGIDKAPGFDGYNFKFIREMWDTIKDDIYDSVMEFFATGGSARPLNVTWVTLIPKVENPTSIEQYRPISMVGSLYKIISKILSFRLKEVMASLIDESQSAFVANRKILDGVLIANESIRWLKKRKIPGTLIKLDFQKEYDSVNWNFLKQVMEKLEFGRVWIKWIMDYVTTASMSILLNGSPLKPFKMEKGLRQGDPLSPYLFLLVSEALVYLLKKAEERNLIEAVRIGKEKVNLKHLQFADDILIFALRNDMCITNYFRILDVFAMMSGLSLNYSKSCFIS